MLKDSSESKQVPAAPAHEASALRVQLWRLKRSVLRGLKGALPPAVTYSKLVNLDSVAEAWPVYKQLAAAPYVRSPAPEDRAAFDVHPIFSHRDVALPPLGVNLIPGALIFAASGMMADRQSRVIVESAKTLGMLQEYREFRSRRRFRAQPFPGPGRPSTIINGGQMANWYHWVIDALPRLYALSQIDDEIALLTPRSLKGAKLKLLEWVLPENVRLHFVEAGPWQCDAAVFTPFVTIGGCGLLRPEIAAYLRQRVLQRVTSQSNSAFSNRIYTTRKFDPVRRIANEDELIDALRQRGFQAVYPGTLSLEEQIACFAGAEMVVGTHGANLTGMLFSTDATLIELAPLNLCYWGICTSAGNRHVAVPNPTQTEQDHWKHRHAVNSADAFYVDVERIVAAVDQALA